jgi:hypothetical protein
MGQGGMGQPPMMGQGRPQGGPQGGFGGGRRRRPPMMGGFEMFGESKEPKKKIK